VDQAEIDFDALFAEPMKGLRRCPLVADAAARLADRLD
jgi:hypothetical protein